MESLIITDMATVIGVSGAVILLVFFLLNQFHKIEQDSIWYDSANVIGGLLLVYYAYLIESLPFFILNAVWAGFSLRDVIHYFVNKNV